MDVGPQAMACCPRQEVGMKRLLIIILFLNIILGFSSNRSVDNDFCGSYSGCNNQCERISLDIYSPNEVSAVIASTEFVGHFCDDMEGEYEVYGDTILIKWTLLNTDNTKYTKLGPERDTVILVNPHKTIKFMQYGHIGDGATLESDSEDVKLTDVTNPFAELAYQLFILALCIVPFYFIGRYFYKRMNKEDE